MLKGLENDINKTYFAIPSSEFDTVELTPCYCTN